jgi:hypothetical protein
MGLALFWFAGQRETVRARWSGAADQRATPA